MIYACSLTLEKGDYMHRKSACLWEQRARELQAALDEECRRFRLLVEKLRQVFANVRVPVVEKVYPPLAEDVPGWKVFELYDNPIAREAVMRKENNDTQSD